MAVVLSLLLPLQWTLLYFLAFSFFFCPFLHFLHFFPFCFGTGFALFPFLACFFFLSPQILCGASSELTSTHMLGHLINLKPLSSSLRHFSSIHPLPAYTPWGLCTPASYMREKRRHTHKNRGGHFALLSFLAGTSHPACSLAWQHAGTAWEERRKTPHTPGELPENRADIVGCLGFLEENWEAFPAGISQPPPISSHLLLFCLHLHLIFFASL